MTKDKNTDKEKIESIYKYIVNNIKYDYNKVKGLSNNYVPEIDKILADKSGICYDYASLKKSNGKVSMIKNNTEYTNIREY